MLVYLNSVKWMMIMMMVGWLVGSLVGWWNNNTFIQLATTLRDDKNQF
jgi:uncharacterized membrane protein YfcA